MRGRCQSPDGPDAVAESRTADLDGDCCWYVMLIPMSEALDGALRGAELFPGAKAAEAAGTALDPQSGSAPGPVRFARAGSEGP